MTDMGYKSISIVSKATLLLFPGIHFCFDPQLHRLSHSNSSPETREWRTLSSSNTQDEALVSAEHSGAGKLNKC